MKLGSSLFIIYLLGKIAAVAFHGFHFGPAMLLALFWQDALVAAFVAGLASIAKLPAWVLYSAAVLDFALSAPLLRLMATPLTLPLLRAGSGTLADSIRHHLDAANLAVMAVTLLLGGILPFLFARVHFPLDRRSTVLAGFLVAAAIIRGYFVTGSLDLQGLHRNSLVAFAQSFQTGATGYAPRLHPPRDPPARSPAHGLLTGVNVVLIGLESTGSKHLSMTGGKSDPMPCLSQLAAEGVSFENACAAYPESIKGLFTILFSRQPAFGLKPEHLSRAPGPSLAAILASRGYQTALFHSGRFMYLGMDNVVQAAGFDRAEDAGTIGGNFNSSFGVDDFRTVDHLLDWVDHRDISRPFFIQYLPVSGHHPYNSPVPGPFDGRNDSNEDRTRYLNALNYSDLALKRLIDGLQNRKLLGDTLLVLYGDHGEAFGEHPGNYGHTLYLYDENVRVPLIFSAPPRLRSEQRTNTASLVDIAPSICDLLGFELPPSFEGASLFASAGRPVFFLTEYSLHLRGVRYGEWKLIREEETGFTRLYNIRTDPSEHRNMALSRPGIVRDLEARFFDWSPPSSSHTIAPNPEPATSR